jgi:hypothetical protein
MPWEVWAPNVQTGPWPTAVPPPEHARYMRARWGPAPVEPLRATREHDWFQFGVLVFEVCPGRAPPTAVSGADRDPHGARSNGAGPPQLTAWTRSCACDRCSRAAPGGRCSRSLQRRSRFRCLHARPPRGSENRAPAACRPDPDHPACSADVMRRCLRRPAPTLARPMLMPA